MGARALTQKRHKQDLKGKGGFFWLSLEWVILYQEERNQRVTYASRRDPEATENSSIYYLICWPLTFICIMIHHSDYVLVTFMCRSIYCFFHIILIMS